MHVKERDVYVCEYSEDKRCTWAEKERFVWCGGVCMHMDREGGIYCTCFCVCDVYIETYERGGYVCLLFVCIWGVHVCALFACKSNVPTFYIFLVQGNASCY